MNKEALNKASNKLTEYSQSYKWINIYLMGCYYGLAPSICKLSNILFTTIIRNKLYRERALTKDINEEKRIYNDTELTIEDILNEWNRMKYSAGNNLDTDISNMKKRIKEIEDNNIFYLWKYKSMYMFVMERNCAVWKYYNDKAFVSPKTIKKICSVARDMIFCMEKIMRKKYNAVDKNDVEKSFGLFINKMIEKTNPCVASEMFMWDGCQNVLDYIADLSDKINDIDDDEGLSYSDDFIDNLPYVVANKIVELMNGENSMKETDKEQQDMLNDIVPENPNMVRSPKKRGRKKKAKEVDVSNVVPQKPTALVYGASIDPFKNATYFVRFYRAVMNELTMHRASYESWSVEAKYAADILDVLIDHSRKDIIFLKAWIRYFFDNNLKGDKFTKSKHTSLKCLLETFNAFNLKYFIPQQSV